MHQKRDGCIFQAFCEACLVTPCYLWGRRALFHDHVVHGKIYLRYELWIDTTSSFSHISYANLGPFRLNFLARLPTLFHTLGYQLKNTKLKIFYTALLKVSFTQNFAFLANEMLPNGKVFFVWDGKINGSCCCWLFIKEILKWIKFMAN